jgi:hypothetical protein
MSVLKSSRFFYEEVRRLVGKLIEKGADGLYQGEIYLRWGCNSS